MGKQKRERVLADNEARAVARTIRTSPQKLNDVAAMIRGKKASKALADLEFYNCGPAPMVHAAVEVQLKHCAAHQIYSAIDYLTKCGVGICGACAAPDGRRLCVDGPFLGIASP